MSDLISVFSKDNRNIIRKDFPFVEGAWVDFYDDLTFGQAMSAQKMLEEKNLSLDFILPQVCDWNFADLEGKKMAIDKYSFNQFSTRQIKWFSQMIFESLKQLEQEEKKSTA